MRLYQLNIPRIFGNDGAGGRDAARIRTDNIDIDL